MVWVFTGIFTSLFDVRRLQRCRAYGAPSMVIVLHFGILLVGGVDSLAGSLIEGIERDKSIG